MKGSTVRNAFVIAASAVACFLSAQAATAQESWGSSGGASAWQAGSPSGSVPAARAIVSGGGSSWTAGKGSVESAPQPGGVWRDGSTLNAPVSKVPAKGSPTDTYSISQPRGPSGIGQTPATNPGSSPSSKTPLPHSSIGLHPSTGPHNGVGSNSRGGVFKSSNARTTASGQRNQSGSKGAPQKRNAVSSGLDSTTPSDSSLKSLADPSSTNTLEKEMQTTLGETPH
jgi:hypothetical protein